MGVCMWNPFHRDYRSAKAAAQLRTSTGSFSSPASAEAKPQQATAIKTEAETKSLENLLNVQAGMTQLMARMDEATVARQNAINAQAAALAQTLAGQQPKGTDWIAVGREFAPFVPDILQRVDAIIQRFAPGPATQPGQEWSRQPGQNQTWTTPPAAPAAPAQESPSSFITVDMLKELANANKAKLKLAKATIGGKVADGLAQNGLSVDVLRRAIDNLEKILPILPAQDQTTITEAVE